MSVYAAKGTGLGGNVRAVTRCGGANRDSPKLAGLKEALAHA